MGHELRVRQGWTREDIQEKIDRGKHGMARGARGAEPQDAQDLAAQLRSCLPPLLVRACDL